MASSPPAPYSANLPNPRKRPSMSSQVSLASISKRPKLHPLRQTSFPATGDHRINSSVISARSETGSIANSTFSTTSGRKSQARGRGRPRKSLQIVENDSRTSRDGVNAAGNQAKSVISTARSNTNVNDEDPEDDEDEELDLLDNEGEENDSKREEEEKVNILIGQLTKEQNQRYIFYRSSALKLAVVKRIVNQTVSQSVAQSAIQAVTYYTKAFTIEIVERAREVQREHARAAEVSIEVEKQQRMKAVQDKRDEFAQREKDPSLTELDRRVFMQDIKRLSDDAEQYIPNKHKGGLLPDHLREALRRYKADGDGGGFGMDGLSHHLLGVHGAAAWRMGDGASGQRLFR